MRPVVIIMNQKLVSTCYLTSVVLLVYLRTAYVFQSKHLKNQQGYEKATPCKSDWHTIVTFRRNRICQTLVEMSLSETIFVI